MKKLILPNNKIAVVPYDKAQNKTNNAPFFLPESKDSLAEIKYVGRLTGIEGAPYIKPGVTVLYKKNKAESAYYGGQQLFFIDVEDILGYELDERLANELFTEI